MCDAWDGAAGGFLRSVLKGDFGSSVLTPSLVTLALVCHYYAGNS